jgi:hypothetical protein
MKLQLKIIDERIRSLQLMEKAPDVALHTRLSVRREFVPGTALADVAAAGGAPDVVNIGDRRAVSTAIVSTRAPAAGPEVVLDVDALGKPGAAAGNLACLPARLARRERATLGLRGLGRGGGASCACIVKDVA